MTKAYYKKYYNDGYGCVLIEISPTGKYKTINGEMYVEHEYFLFLGKFRRSKWISENDVYFEEIEYFNCKTNSKTKDKK